MTSLLNYMKIYHLAQISLVGDRQTDALISLPFHFIKESRLKEKYIITRMLWDVQYAR
jgi:hypothetical protein